MSAGASNDVTKEVTNENTASGEDRYRLSNQHTASGEDRYRLSNQHTSTWWDPVLYATELCSMQNENSPYTAAQRGILKQQHQLFNQGLIEGQRLLEIGCGPSPHYAIIPAQHFDDIYLSEYAESHLQMLRDWLEKKVNAMDYSKVFTYISDLYSKRKTPEELEQNARLKIKDVFKCDILLENPFDPVKLDQFDCVTSSTCLEGTCATPEDYEQSLGHIAALVKPGGHFVQTVYVNDEVYILGGNKIECLSLTLEQIKKALRDTGFDLKWCEFKAFSEEDVYEDGEYAGFATLHSIKA